MQQGKLRINRIRLEFKDIYALYAKDAVVVLIESDWNLKIFFIDRNFCFMSY